MSTICSCIAYSPQLALSGFASHPRGDATELVLSCLCEGAGLRYAKKSGDVYLCIIGICRLFLAAPLSDMPPTVAGVLPNLISSLAALDMKLAALEDYESAKRRRERADEAAFREEEGIEEGDEEDGGEGDDASDYSIDPEDADAEGRLEEYDEVADEEDFVNAEEVAFRQSDAGRNSSSSASSLLTASASAEGGGTAPDIPEGDNDEVDTPIRHERGPIGHIRHRLWVQEAIAALASQDAATPLLSTIPPSVQECVNAIIAKAIAERSAGAVRGEWCPRAAVVGYASPPSSDDEDGDEEGGGEK